MSRIAWMLPLALLAACGGDDTESTEECTNPAPMTVNVTVLAPDGVTPVADLPTGDDPGGITLDGAECSNDGEGKYTCEALADGNWSLSIVDTRYTSYGAFLPLPLFECGSNPPFNTQVMLAGMMGS